MTMDHNFASLTQVTSIPVKIPMFLWSGPLFLEIHKNFFLLGTQTNAASNEVSPKHVVTISGPRDGRQDIVQPHYCDSFHEKLM